MLNSYCFNLDVEEIAQSNAVEQLPWKVHRVVQCGKCRGWYCTGDTADWQLNEGFEYWNDEDWRRIVYERFREQIPFYAPGLALLPLLALAFGHGLLGVLVIDVVFLGGLLVGLVSNLVEHYARRPGLAIAIAFTGLISVSGLSAFGGGFGRFFDFGSGFGFLTGASDASYRGIRHVCLCTARGGSGTL